MIAVLDNETIDKIAAGEVIERPMSVIKELVENSIDAGATSITVEIKNGGIDYIRITDNGCGINKNEVSIAFLRHATSKIKSITDLLSISSLGFRGEALSSIAAVSKVELLTKTEDSISGVRYVIEGGKEKILEDVGMPNGTTFVIRGLFYNTPARRKFLKSSLTEASYVTELMEHIMLSHPEISFKLIINGKSKLQTLGKGDLKTVIYEIYGKDMTDSLIPFTISSDTITINGFIGKPEIARGNRNYEIYYVNGRFVKSSLVSRALDEAYKSYLMLHKFPVVFLCLDIDSDLLDVNVHPTKMEIRFLEAEQIYSLLVTGIQSQLKNRELIPDILEKEVKNVTKVIADPIPEPFEKKRLQEYVKEAALINQAELKKAESNSPEKNIAESDKAEIITSKETENKKLEIDNTNKNNSNINETNTNKIYSDTNIEKNKKDITITENNQPESKPKQLNLFEDSFLSAANVIKHKIIGQIFDTYWLVEMDNKLYIIDQHAAHEKVLYERLVKQLNESSVESQMLMPPVVVSLSLSQEALLKKYMSHFEKNGFEIEHFGGKEYYLRAVPTQLFGLSADEYFLELLDELSADHQQVKMESIDHRIATMACKSAVKGNSYMSREEAIKLIDELMTLDNPYNCPHGRPVIISYSKYEIEKKFKRII